ncbi:ion transporter [Mycobacterium interjectum]|uniref:ion transporter n=1 Tax=Mycobacterium interjectum TaxID=33895 RepID=UPI0008322A8A|nr:ion transporter [Mycobacterium interjectum]MCV7089463.1 ion transporter [Mycobacterium interjectum]
MSAVDAARHADKRGFESVVTAVIVVNSALLVWGVVAHDDVAEHLETGCLVFFVGELVVRLRRNGWNAARFVRSPWVVFDAIVIALALAPTLVGADATLLRLARLSRLVHWLRHVSHFRAVRLLTGPAH